MYLRIFSAESDNITDSKVIWSNPEFHACFHISTFPRFQTTKVSTLTIKLFNAYFHISTFPDYQT